MATFSELQTRVRTRVIDLPTAVNNEVPALVNKAIREAQDRHNFKTMEANVSFTTTEGQRKIGDVPSDFKEFRSQPYYEEEAGDSHNLTVTANLESVLDAFGTNPDHDIGFPVVLLYNKDDEFEVFPFPDGNSDYSDGEYRIEVPYWKYLADLSGSDDTNWFTNNMEWFIVFRAASDAFAIDWDEERSNYWRQQAEAEFQRGLNRDKSLKLSPVHTLVPHLGARGPKLRY